MCARQFEGQVISQDSKIMSFGVQRGDLKRGLEAVKQDILNKSMTNRVEQQRVSFYSSQRFPRAGAIISLCFYHLGIFMVIFDEFTFF